VGKHEPLPLAVAKLVGPLARLAVSNTNDNLKKRVDLRLKRARGNGPVTTPMQTRSAG
jgi:hypothetical protein